MPARAGVHRVCSVVLFEADPHRRGLTSPQECRRFCCEPSLWLLGAEGNLRPAIPQRPVFVTSCGFCPLGKTYERCSVPPQNSAISSTAAGASCTVRKFSEEGKN